MLAPRSKLWSSPLEVIEVALDMLALGRDDVVYDLGCGDGRFVVEAARRYQCACVGIEIEEARAEEARQRVKEAGLEALVQIRCENALHLSTIDKATAIYLYLVPRGLRLILPKLLTSNFRIVSYMSPLPGLAYTLKRTATPAHQPDAKWPLFLYESSSLSRQSCEETEKASEASGSI